MSNRVYVSNLCLYGRHGVLPEESALGQKFFLDIDCLADIEEAIRDDDYGKAVGYDHLCDLAIEISGSNRFNLIETLAERIAVEVLRRFPSVSEVTVRVRKPWAPIPAVLDHAGVEIIRSRSTAFALSLGSNVGDKAANIRAAIGRIAADPRIAIGAVSHLYRTEPWGKTDQDWFVNACLTGTTSLSASQLLHRVKGIEVEIGRLPGPRWGPRVIDIDLLHLGETEIRTEELILPHPEMFNRAFVLVPLAEIAPDRIIAGRRVADAAEALRFGEDEVVRIQP